MLGVAKWRKNHSDLHGFGFFRAIHLEITVMWDDMSSALVEGYRR